MEADPAILITVDLQERKVNAGEFTCNFEVDDYVRWRLLEGLDDIGITLEHSDVISEFEKRRPGFLPSLG